jgi:large subunit ribosomal protein L35
VAERLEGISYFCGRSETNIDMPKVKTHSSAKKRFKVTGTGKVKRFQAKTSHMMRNKTKKQKLRLRDAVLVSRADEPRVKKLLGI